MPCTCSAIPELIRGGTIVPMIRRASSVMTWTTLVKEEVELIVSEAEANFLSKFFCLPKHIVYG